MKVAILNLENALTGIRDSTSDDLNWLKTLAKSGLEAAGDLQKQLEQYQNLVIHGVATGFLNLKTASDLLHTTPEHVHALVEQYQQDPAQSPEGKVRAKMKCTSSGSNNYGSFQSTLEPVYDPNPDTENGKFYQYTPSGNVNLNGIREETANRFEVGRFYYVDFTLAE